MKKIKRLEWRIREDLNLDPQFWRLRCYQLHHELTICYIWDEVGLDTDLWPSCFSTHSQRGHQPRPAPVRATPKESISRRRVHPRRSSHSLRNA